MKTKQRVLLALLAAAVLLGAALWAVTRSNAKAEQATSAAAEGSIPLSTFAAEDMEQIEYTFNGEAYTLQYSGGSWQLAQDPAYHLDESTCNTMRTALMALNAKRSLTPQAGEDYGLDSPQLTVTVTAAGQSTTLIFGAENPVTGDLYVQKAGDDAIYTVSGNKVACFQLDKAGLFGSFCPTGLTASAITQVAYTLADGTSVTLNAVSEPTESADSASSSAYETVWRLASDPAVSLAQDKVQSLLSALCTPHAALKELQDTNQFTELMVRQEELKTLPFGEVWDEYCRRNGVPVDGAWFEEVKKYEQNVLSKRI